MPTGLQARALDSGVSVIVIAVTALINCLIGTRFWYREM